ncbi:hypothetical protein [Lacunimicrobium album]
MRDFDLNPGGIIIGLALGGAGAWFVFSRVGNNPVDPDIIRYLVIFALIGGAIAGNYLWGLLFPPPADATPSQTTDVPSSDDIQNV